ncbi:hypothetical protein ABY45_07075, partial [Microbacterium maritypicum]|uniref:hypothetical protein n=1 Tax=Microbacterium maritypicum TaxID=33918 RepID=UPI003D6F6844
ATGFSDTLRKGVTPAVQGLAQPSTEATLKGLASMAPGHSQQLADGLADLLATSPDDAKIRDLVTLAMQVDGEVDALVAPAASAPALAQGLVAAAGGSARVTAGVNALISGDASQKWPGTAALIAPQG